MKEPDEQQVDVAVYPNPSNGEFTLKVRDSQETYHFAVYDITGRCIENRYVEFTETNRVNFNLQQKGLYFISLSNTNGILTKKVIVQ